MPGVWTEYERDPDVFGNHEFKQGSLCQAEVYDDDLKPLGTALFQTVTSGQWGDWVELHYVACENDYYAYWMNSGEFPVREEYHICKKGVKHCSCKKAGKPDLVHLSKLRTISPAECLDLKWLKGIAKKKLTVFFEKDNAEVALGSRDEAEVNTPGAGVSVSKAEGLFGDGRRKRGSFADSVQDLRKAVGETRRPEPDAREDRRDPSRTRRGRSRSVRVDPFAGPSGQRARARSPETGRRNSERAHPEKKEEEVQERPSEEGAVGRDRCRSSSRRRSVSRRSSPPWRGRGRSRSRGARGHGPFPRSSTLAPRRRSRSRSRSRSGQVFREASPSFKRHSHIRLVEYSNLYPGLLAQQLLQRMQEMVQSGGEAIHFDRSETPAVATVYFHTVFHPAHRGIGLRNWREARTFCRALDHLARQEIVAAADWLCQRLKALEKAQKESNDWSRAQWLELLPPEGMTLVGREEELMTTKEEELQSRIRYRTGKDKDKGKGKYKDGTDGKGKGKNKKW